MAEIACTNCNRPYPPDGVPYRCPACTGLFDFSAFPVYDPAQIEPALAGIHRYRHAFGLPDDAPLHSLGEGQTPLVWNKAFGRRVAFKLEFLNPTGSFKDRGSVVLLSFLRSRGVSAAVEDSSGNAGASFAAYAAAAGVQARVFVPDAASGPKRKQIEAYGAEIVRILGPRSNAAEAALRAVEGGAVYASHAYLPHVLSGYATLAYELFEQLGGAPGSVILPAGQGNLLLGALRGFVSMKASGLILSVPVMVGVQALACAPLWALYQHGPAGLGWVTEGETLAEGVRIRRPLRGDAVLNALSQHGGRMLAVEEEAILAGRAALAGQGFYVEPTSAIVWDALEQCLHPGAGPGAAASLLFSTSGGAADTTALPDPVVVVLTGSGLKSP